MTESSGALSDGRKPPQALPIFDVMFGLVGPTVWAAHFLMVYFVQATACSMTASSRTVVVVIIGLTVIAIAGLVWALARLTPDRLDARLRRYLPMARYSIALSILAVAWSSFAMVLLEPCPPAGG
jgi:hypothetical protein